MTKQFIETVLLALANERKVFWSEADFQFAFARKLKEMFEDRNPQSAINVRLERRADTLEQRTDAPEQGNEKENSGDIYIDIWGEINEKVYPIELKYKTIKCTLKDGPEEYKLKQHGACDIGCYLYLKDVERIEHISKSLGDNFGKGYAIMLTNDHLYWDKPNTSTDTTIFRDFRIHKGRKIVAGATLDWGTPSDNRPAWQKRLKSFELNHNYRINWGDYSNLNEEGEANEKEKMPPFKYTIIEIN